MTTHAATLQTLERLEAALAASERRADEYVMSCHFVEKFQSTFIQYFNIFQ